VNSAFALMVASCVALGGCGRIATYRYGLVASPIPVATAPTLFFGADLPSTTMQEVALVEAVGEGTRANRDDVLSALQREGARFGADALVHVTFDCGAGSCHSFAVAVRFVPRAQR
jgi:hypothetical protein